MRRLLSQFVLWYLRIAAKLQLLKSRPTIIGVAGSSGKSSLVKLLYETLQDTMGILSSGGKNSESGIPLSILGIHMDNYKSKDWIKALIAIKLQLFFNWKKYDVYIAEMGIDSPVEPKNMSYLLKIVQPTIGMITNISLEHSVYFDTYVEESTEVKRKEKILQMTANQELLLLQAIPKHGTAIVNLDDTRIVSFKNQVKAKQITISLHNISADLLVTDIRVSLDQFTMNISYQGKIYPLKLPQALPEFYAYEFLFVLATAITLHQDISKTIFRLEKHFSLPAGRFSVLRGIKNTILIDSSYNNATLEPVLGILSLLKKVAHKRRFLAIIGDMRELGSQAKEAHSLLADALAKNADEIILIGPLLAQYCAPILKKRGIKSQTFTTFTDAKQAIIKSVQSKDIVLVKGSQNTLFLERAVELLLADKKNVEKLCRRGEFWDEQREKTP